jgi:hypothetical protein
MGLSFFYIETWVKYFKQQVIFLNMVVQLAGGGGMAEPIYKNLLLAHQAIKAPTAPYFEGYLFQIVLVSEPEICMYKKR